MAHSSCGTEARPISCVSGAALSRMALIRIGCLLLLAVQSSIGIRRLQHRAPGDADDADAEASPSPAAVISELVCTNGCSGRGVCTQSAVAGGPNVCSCYSNYTGSYCQTAARECLFWCSSKPAVAAGLCNPPPLLRDCRRVCYSCGWPGCALRLRASIVCSPSTPCSLPARLFSFCSALPRRLLAARHVQRYNWAVRVRGQL